MLSTAKLSTKGQIVIPKPLRDKLGLKPGDPLVVGVDGDRLILRKITFSALIEESKRNYETGNTLSHEETFEGLT
jgi:AbrB family transcriptional regulator (stage V sporulation protein T)